MKNLHVVSIIVCAISLAACDASRFLPDAKAAKANAAQSFENQREGSIIRVPDVSPLRKTLVIEAIQLQRVTQKIDAPGVIEAEPEKLVKIVPPLGGRIVRLHRQLGDTVKAGDPLATIDSPDLGSAYSEQIKAQAALLQAQREYARQKSLQDEGISAKKDLETARLALSAAESDARATRDRLMQLGATAGADSRREYILRSPITGRVIEMNGAQGSYWNDTNASIMMVADLSSVWLTAAIAEKDLSQMFIGQPVRIVLNAYASRTFDGNVKYIGDLLDPDTRTTRVRVAIDNRERLFKPGMFARASFSGPVHQALLLPATALFQSGLYTRVFVEQAPLRFQSRVVSVGPTIDDRVEVLSGLKAGERVVIKEGVLLNND